ncbi:Protein FLX-like 2 [Linum perenne]
METSSKVLLKELQQARIEAEKLASATQELMSKVHQLNQEIHKADMEAQEIPALLSELEGLRQEQQRCRDMEQLLLPLMLLMPVLNLGLELQSLVMSKQKKYRDMIPPPRDPVTMYREELAMMLQKECMAMIHNKDTTMGMMQHQHQLLVLEMRLRDENC